MESLKMKWVKPNQWWPYSGEAADRLHISSAE